MCILNNKVNYLNNNIPIVANFSCKKLFFNYNYHQPLIGGIKFSLFNIKYNLNNTIPNQFMISKIFIENRINHSFILIKGKLYESISKDINDLIIFVTYPKFYLTCNLKKSSKYVQSSMNCYTKKFVIGQILIENQIIYNRDYTEKILIIDELTLLLNYEILNYGESKKDKEIFYYKALKEIKNFFYQNICYFFFIIFIFLKYYKKKILKKHKYIIFLLIFGKN